MNVPEQTMSSRKEWLPKYRVPIFCLLLLLILFGLARVFDHAAKKDLRSKARWIISKKGGTYDFAVLGASRTYGGVLIKSLEEALGQRGINLSIDGVTYPEEYLALKLFLARNQMRHLILDASIFGFDNSAFKYPFHAYEYLPEISNPVVFDSLRDNFGHRAYLWKYAPFFKNAEFNSKLGPIQVYSWIKMRFDENVKLAEFDETGTRLLEGRKRVDKQFQDDIIRMTPAKTYRWDKMPKKCFMDILELAEKHGIKVTLLMMPEYYLSTTKQRNRAEIISFYESIALSNNIPILRFDQDDICSDKSMFLDTVHLNKNGAQIFSINLAKRLREQDHGAPR
jgi:hypothetical protein